MNKKLRGTLMAIAKKRIKSDVSHDFTHAYRVLTLAEKIAKSEKADLDIVVPAALFHDVIIYKGTPKYKYETQESAKLASEILKKVKGYPQSKIEKAAYSISVCSFSKNIRPKLLEAKILQDADLLEATGAIAIMRTFASTMTMHNTFYDTDDPFCKNRKPNDKLYSLDLFFTRLLVANQRMHTKMAKQIAKTRINFLHKFIKELSLELKESYKDMV
jgi:uncharacterized protein